MVFMRIRNKINFRFGQIDIEGLKNLFKALTRKNPHKKMVLKYQNILKSFSKYPNQLKQADILPPHKTSQRFLRKVKDL